MKQAVKSISVVSANLARIGDGSSDPEATNAINSDLSREAVEEYILTSDFQVETSAQQYFNDNHGEQVRGIFHEVEVTKFYHDEGDWSIAQTELVTSANPSDKTSDPVEIDLGKDLWKYALLIMSVHPNGEVTTRELIEATPNYVKLSDDHMATNESRGDSKFSQIVRNLKSHKTSKSNFIFKGYAEDIRGGFKITGKGIEFVRSYFKK